MNPEVQRIYEDLSNSKVWGMCKRLKTPKGRTDKELRNSEVQRIYDELRDREAKRIYRVLRNDPPEAQRIDMELRNKAQKTYEGRWNKAVRIDKERRDKAERRRNRRPIRIRRCKYCPTCKGTVTVFVCLLIAFLYFGGIVYAVRVHQHKKV